MKDIWEIFEELDFNNITGVIVVSIFLIIIFTSCIEPLWASNIEVILMNKTDILKRKSLVVIIMFSVLALMNYVFIFDNSFLIANILIFGLSIIGYMGINILNKVNKFKTFVSRLKEYVWFMIIMTFFPLMAYAIFYINSINKVSCAIICALIEVMIIMLSASKYEPMDSKLILEVEKENWYVFRRMDDALLCGDAKTLNNSQKIKLIKLDTILDENLYFKKAE